MCIGEIYLNKSRYIMEIWGMFLQERAAHSVFQSHLAYASSEIALRINIAHFPVRRLRSELIKRRTRRRINVRAGVQRLNINTRA